MDRNTSQTAGGADRYGSARGQFGYVSRPAIYYSVSRPVSTPQTIPQNPTIAEASEAAKRIVLPEATVYTPPARTNHAGSFDMLAPQKTVQKQPAQPISYASSRPEPKATTYSSNINVAPALPAKQQWQRSETVQQNLPTDLKPLTTQFSEAPVVKPNKLKIGLPKLTVPRVIVGMAITLFVAGTAVTLLSLKTNKQVVAQVKSVTKTQVEVDSDGGTTSGIPDEEGNPPSVDYYRTAATYPRVLRIPKISVEARVLALNIAPTGALKAPANVFDTGWYKDSSRPGEAGAMVVDGHVSGPTKGGVFKNLSKLAKGDKVEVERGDGSKFTYTVQATKVFDADKLDMSSVMVPIVPGKPGLNIITCAGKFNKTTNTFEQRTVVYAVIN